LTDKVQCPGCGHLSARGTSFCAECSSALFKICSQCEQRGPVDANFCAECGGRLISHTDLAARKGAEQAAAGHRRVIRALLVVGASLAATWFLCVAPIIGWLEREGISTSDLVLPTNAPRLSQAQIEATRQAEIVARTLALTADTQISLGDVVDTRRTYDNKHSDSLRTYVTVVVANNGDTAHRVILAYEFGGETQYQDLEIQPQSSKSFVAEHVANLGWNFISGGFNQLYDWDGVFFLARVEALDDLNREDISSVPEWDWEIRFVNFGSVSDYPCDYGECRQDEP
jgi:ribosomal protein L40E